MDFVTKSQECEVYTIMFCVGLAGAIELFKLVAEARPSSVGEFIELLLRGTQIE